ncbi:CHAP domain protein [Bifidobacterium saguini DSM 23967]|uniref:CHAP domain protein n=2 Tax=Bifidobacterium saguini TaxID=762210 RepID=A0A087D5P5_9BIFI|nr:CHAP domain-containing protein [Bifidobacterium saguini]KFI90845.1 CHAP domain protein [Bifidobacterium saguini DSM 23967]QTB90740.1 CHAP domain-containing protein [Bifidobacterium saguini]
MKRMRRVRTMLLAACILTLMGGCTPLGVLQYMNGCKDGSASAGGTGGSVVTGEVRDGMNITQTRAWFDGEDGPDGVCRGYPAGQCTWWACMRGHRLGLDVGSHWGNGGDWGRSAASAGWRTTITDPVAGSIVSYAPGVAGAATFYGHVAIVESVDSAAGTVTISEMNAAAGPGIVNHRTHRIDVGAVYILPDGHSDGSTGTHPDSTGQTSTVEAAWTCSTGATAHPGADYEGDGTHASPEEAQAIAKRMIASYSDWDDADYDALVWLWNHESGWRWNATNPSSGAYGIPQSLPASKMASAGDDWKDNAATQIKWGLDYIRGRYGSPSAARSFWLRNNWY